MCFERDTRSPYNLSAFSVRESAISVVTVSAFSVYERIVRVYVCVVSVRVFVKVWCRSDHHPKQPAWRWGCRWGRRRRTSGSSTRRPTPPRSPTLSSSATGGFSSPSSPALTSRASGSTGWVCPFSRGVWHAFLRYFVGVWMYFLQKISAYFCFFQQICIGKL